jgi:hypothetical protein
MDVCDQFTATGLSVEDVIYRATDALARQISHSELGH